MIDVQMNDLYLHLNLPKPNYNLDVVKRFHLFDGCWIVFDVLLKFDST